MKKTKILIFGYLILFCLNSFANWKVILEDDDEATVYSTEKGIEIFWKDSKKTELVGTNESWGKYISPDEKYLLYTDDEDENIILQNIETGKKEIVQTLDKNGTNNGTISIEIEEGIMILPNEMSKEEFGEIVWSPNSQKFLIHVYRIYIGPLHQEGSDDKYCIYDINNPKNGICDSPYGGALLGNRGKIELGNDGIYEEEGVMENYGKYIRKNLKTGEVELLDLNKKIIEVVNEGREITENPKKSPFSDLGINHPLYKKIIQAVEEGWISGYPDGTIKLEKKVNRAEFAKMLVLAFGKNMPASPLSLRGAETGDVQRGDIQDSSQTQNDSGLSEEEILKKFSDIEKNAWYREFLAKAVEKGIMAGYPDLTMKPAKTINGAESLKMVLEAFGKNSSQAQNDSKLSKNSESGLDLPWYTKYVTKLKNILGENIPQFVKEENFEYEITRADAISLIVDVENSKNKK